MDEGSLDNWFIREILVHEDTLVSYLLRRWPNRPDVNDLRQDTYVRVYEAAAKSRPPVPKAFLFSTAAHLLADRMPQLLHMEMQFAQSPMFTQIVSGALPMPTKGRIVVPREAGLGLRYLPQAGEPSHASDSRAAQ